MSEPGTYGDTGLRDLNEIVASFKERIEVQKITKTMNDEREVTYVIRSKAIRAEAVKAVSEVRGDPLMEVTIRRHRKKFSREQQNRYWEILRQISEKKKVEGRHYSPECWAEHFKREFIGVEETPGGALIGLSTNTLDVSAFNDHMTKIEAWAAENDVTIILNTL